MDECKPLPRGESAESLGAKTYGALLIATAVSVAGAYTRPLFSST